MPNTFAHLGIGGILTRAAIKKADLIWIYIGAVIPDIPWILQRIISTLDLGINPYDLRIYCIVLASLFFSMIMSLALANLTVNVKKTFIILTAGALIHLLLDSIEIKWANGIHLFAPFNWQIINVGYFWPEDFSIYIITFLGLLYLVFNFKRAITEFTSISLSSRKRMITILVCLPIYFLLPLIFMKNAEAANNHFVKTIRDLEHRAGSYFEIDRGYYLNSPNGDKYLTPFREKLSVLNLDLATSADMSIRARFISETEIQIIDYHIHSDRDLFSYMGLFLILILLVSSLILKYKNRAKLL